MSCVGVWYGMGWDGMVQTVRYGVRQDNPIGYSMILWYNRTKKGDANNNYSVRNKRIQKLNDYDVSLITVWYSTYCAVRMYLCVPSTYSPLLPQTE
jgi:hypothetical protein